MELKEMLKIITKVIIMVESVNIHITSKMDIYDFDEEDDEITLYSAAGDQLTISNANTLKCNKVDNGYVVNDENVSYYFFYK